MRKLFLIIAVVLLVIFSAYYLTSYGIQMVSVDKKVYSAGESINIHWSDFGLSWCTCMGRHLAMKIYQKEGTEWKEIIYKPQFGCVNGSYAGLNMYMCDVVQCSLIPKIASSKNSLVWNAQVYENIGMVNKCRNPYTNKEMNATMPNLELKNTPPGIYKVKFGSAEKRFEIK